mgnify:CR=1 FL=1
MPARGTAALHGIRVPVTTLPDTYSQKLTA